MLQNKLRNYGKRLGLLLYFIAYVGWRILKSNFIVAKYVLNPNVDLKPFIAAIPLEPQSDFELAIFASVITLTPGTLSVDVGYEVDENNEKGQRVLFVHGLAWKPVDYPMKPKNNLESLILKITGTKPL